MYTHNYYKIFLLFSRSSINFNDKNKNTTKIKKYLI